MSHLNCKRLLRKLQKMLGGYFMLPHPVGHFGDESFQSITCTGTDNLTRTTKRENTNNINAKSGNS